MPRMQGIVSPSPKFPPGSKHVFAVYSADFGTQRQITCTLYFEFVQDEGNGFAKFNIYLYKHHKQLYKQWLTGHTFKHKDSEGSICIPRNELLFCATGRDFRGGGVVGAEGWTLLSRCLASLFPVGVFHSSAC